MLQQKISDRFVAQVEVNAFIRETDFDTRFDVGTASQGNALPEHVPGYKAGEASEGAGLQVGRILGYIVQADQLLRQKDLHCAVPNGLFPCLSGDFQYELLQNLLSLYLFAHQVFYLARSPLQKAIL